jgi:hypothetical protein
MSAELTPWFSYHCPPVRIGYYDTKTAWTEMRLWWNGRAWKASKNSPEHSAHFHHMRDWRGLASDPSAKVSP